MTKNWERFLIAAMPVGMLLLWMAVIARGNGRLDALGNPVGADFAMFYIAGNMAWQGEWHLLYNEPEQQRRLLELFPGLPLDTYLPYRYPPTLAGLLAPLGALPYRTAQLLWSLASIAVWLVSWLLLSRTFLPKASKLAGTCLVGLVASPVLSQTIIDGQASCFWFGILAATWIAFHHKQYALAGMCLSLAACKPNVLLLVGITLVIKQPRLLVGVVPAGLILLVSTIGVAGRESLSAYIELGSRLATQSWSVETPYWKVQSLLSWSQPLLGSAARSAHLVIGLVAAFIIGWWWRQHDKPIVQDRSNLATIATLRFDGCALGLALLNNALFNPYTPVYDLLILSLGMFAWLVYAERAGVLTWALQQREIGMLVACLWAGPIISQCLSRELACPQQWMPLVMVILIFCHAPLTSRQWVHDWIARSSLPIS